MAGRHKFSDLIKEMPPERQRRIEQRTRVLLAQQAVRELRQMAGFTQMTLSKAMGISQPALSQLERQVDMQIKTLRRVVEACGGTLEMVAHMPDGDVTLELGETKKAEDKVKAKSA